MNSVRKRIIAANWKSNKTVPEALDFVRTLSAEIKRIPANVEAVICPSFTALMATSQEIANSGVDFQLGAQDMCWEPPHQSSGALTGEITIPMLRDLSVRYVILGHSERRRYFGATDSKVNQQAKAAITGDLVPIVCVGETEPEYEAKMTNKVIEGQLMACLHEFNNKQIEQTVIAYEPIWAIGTGKTATPAEAQAAHKCIRSLLSKLFGDKAADCVRVQYGGSVKPANAAELMGQPDVDGLLVGGASLEARSFADIVKNSIT